MPEKPDKLLVLKAGGADAPEKWTPDGGMPWEGLALLIIGAVLGALTCWLFGPGGAK
jgi:hypothetical protein